MGKLTWRGKEVAARVAAAAELAIEKTMADCVADARADHPPFPPASEPYERYANRTTDNTGSIVSNGTTFDGRRVKGSWGSYTRYSLFLEIGTSIMGPTATEREMGAATVDEPFDPGREVGWPGVPPPIGPKMAPRPYLRPAADEEYPLLAARIRAYLNGTEVP